MRVHVAFTPAEAASSSIGIVVDVLRATSTIAQALATGYDRVYCCGEIDEALALKERLGDAILGGERNAVRVEGFDAGASPREFVGEPRAQSVVFSTTNGTRAILETAARSDHVLLGSLLNLGAVAAAARELDDDVTIVCAGFQGTFAIDDAYCAGRIVALLGGEPTETAERALELAASYATTEEAFRTIRRVGETIAEEDLVWCARESVTEVVPRFDGMRGSAARLVA